MSTSTRRQDRGRSADSVDLTIIDSNQRVTRSVTKGKQGVGYSEKKHSFSRDLAQSKSKKKIERKSTRKTAVKATSASKSPNSPARKTGKDSWGDTIFKDDSNNKASQKSRDTQTNRRASKRKSNQVTQGNSKSRSISAKKAQQNKKASKPTTKKSKSTAKEQSEEKKSARNSSEKKTAVTSTGRISTLKKSAATARRSFDLVRQIKYILRLDITLEGLDIPVTRQLLVSTEVTFSKLARIIVSAMGWKGYHDWQFSFEGQTIHTPVRGMAEEQKLYGDDLMVDSFKLRVGTAFEFVYNLECEWKHKIRVIEWYEMPTKGQFERGKPVYNAVLVEGKGACPPDEVEGGPAEYNEMVNVLKTQLPKNTYNEIVDVYGTDLNPYKFEKGSANDLLKDIPYDESYDVTKCDQDQIFLW